MIKMQTSANYALKLMEGTDNVKRQDFVDNFTKIDIEIKNVNNKADSVGIPYVTATGTANTYAVTLSPAPTAYTDGMRVTVKINVACTGASTLNVNSLGAKAIKDSLGNAITSGGLKANTPYTFCYESTSGSFILLGKGGGGDATAAQLLLGKKATVDSGPIVGTLDLTNLVTGNIKSGVTINGVSGKTSVVDTSDALATAAQILSGASAYVGGVKITGTMPDLGNSQNAVDTWQSGSGQLVFRVPSVGAFTSVVNGYKPEVSAYDANFVAANLLAGKTYFGLAGSATIESIGGKNYVEGSFSTVYNVSYVLNLPFTPRMILIYCPAIGYWFEWNSLMGGGFVRIFSTTTTNWFSISGNTITVGEINARTYNYYVWG
jgi:hypothetical protein